MSWLVPPEWYGETAFLVAGGPSLKAFWGNPRLCSKLHGRRIIAINDSYRLFPQADVLYFGDRKWWDTRCKDVQPLFKGKRVITMDNVISGVNSLHCTGEEGLEHDPGGIRHGSNSGYQAMNVAFHFGAKRLVLLGYDMKVSGNDTHWFPMRPENQTAAGYENTLKYAMLPKFRSIVKPLADAGVQVLNVTPNSALTLWPFANLDDVLETV